MSLLIVATLAIGIACSVSMYSVLAGVILEPLPWPQTDRLGVIWNRPPDAADPLEMSQQEIVDLQDLLPAMTIASYSRGRRSVRKERAEAPQSALVTSATRELYALLGSEVRLGRNLEPQEFVRGGPRAVVASWEFWQGQLDGDPDRLGQPVLLGELDYTVVGVMPPEFPLPLDYVNGERTDLWTGTELGYAVDWPRTVRMFPAMARLDSSTSWAEAQVDLDRALATLRSRFPETYGDGWRMELVPVSEELLGRVRPAMIALFGAVLLVMLIACANVANLLLAQGDSRRSEIAVRAALGADRVRLIRQLLFESLWLSLAGGTLGACGAWLVVSGLPKLPAGDLPRFDRVGVDAGVLGFALLMSLATAILFGLVPALRLARRGERAALSSSRVSSGGFSGSARLGGRQLLVVGQIAVAMVLIAGAGLLTQSLRNLLSADLGFEPKGLTSARVSAPRGATPDELVRFWDRVRARAAEEPGIASAAVTMNMPFSSGVMSRSGGVDGVGPPVELPRVTLERAGPGIVKTMGYRLLEGRGLKEEDRVGAESVVVVNRRLAELLGGDAVGRRFRLLDSPTAWMTIVGVVDDVVGESIDASIAPRALISYTQFADLGRRMQSQMNLMLRAEDSQPIDAVTIARLMEAVDPGSAVSRSADMSSVVRDQGLAHYRFAAIVLSMFAAVAIAMSVVGVFGLLMYLVDGSRRALGIRLALGATGGQIRRSVQRGALVLALLGVVIGLPVAVAATRTLDSLLYEVSSTDLRSLVVAVAALVGTTVLAAALPARRAAKVPLTEVLRSD